MSAAPSAAAHARTEGAGTFRHIAVLRLSSLGDVVLTLPVVHALSARYPEARLTYWVKEEFAGVLRADPAIHHVRELERDARRIEDLVSMSAELEDCDLIVDLHGSLRSRVLAFRQKARVLRVRRERLDRVRWVHARWTGPKPLPHATERYARTLVPLGVLVSGPPRIALPAEAEHWADAFRRERGDEASWVGLCPAAHHATKRWPEEHWLALVERVRESGARLVAFSLRREREGLPGLAGAIERAGGDWCTESLERQAALLGRMDAVVTGDTGLMHVAAARGTRVVALFGSTSPVLGFAPAGPGHAVLCRNEPCQPCTIHGRASCPKGHFRCMRELKPDEVLEALRSLLPGGERNAVPPAP